MFNRIIVRIVTVIVLVTVLCIACEQSNADISASDKNLMSSVLLAFARDLVDRNYLKAYARTSKKYQANTSPDNLKTAFEEIVPLDWGTTCPVEVGSALLDWPNQQPGEILWVYVTIGGDVYSEAISVIFSKESNSFKINSVEFGRP